MNVTAEGGEASSSSSPSRSDILQRWKEIQYSLKQRLILEDDFPWKPPTSSTVEEEEDDDKEHFLKYVGGVDVSCLKEDQSIACGTIVVLDFSTGKVVYHDSAYANLDVPYIAGFLAFREAPVLVQLLEKMKKNNNPYYPELVMVDGNGILHPRGFGLASHLGVLANIPTIGIGKKLHYVDGLTEKGVRKCLQAKETSENFITLTGRSGRIHGVAMQSTEGSLRPIFISTGHRISLDTAIKIVKMSCKYRVPEPIRQADKRSRSYVQRPDEISKKLNCLNLEQSSSCELITGNRPLDTMGENSIQAQNGSDQIDRSTFQGRGRGQERRGQGRGICKDRGQVQNEEEGPRWHKKGNQHERSGELSNNRGYHSGRGGGGITHGRGRGRCDRGKSCEYSWVRKDVAR